VTAEEPLVSVIVAAFDAEAFIDRALRSALDQDGAPVEVLVIDDCSTDGTANVVEAWSREDARVRLIRSAANRGPSAARNLGVREARGPWVAVLDADDAYLPGRLAKLIAHAQHAAADIIADNFHYYDAATEDRTGRTGLEASGDCENVDLITYVDRCRPFRTESDYGLLKPVFRRAFLLEHGLGYPEDIRHGEDFALVADALRVGARFVVCRDPMYLYTKRSSGQSRTRVDYSEAIEHAKRLGRRAVEEGQGDLARRLTARGDALADLQLRSNIAGAMARRDYGAVVGLAFGSWRGATRVAAFVARSLRKRVRRHLPGGRS
jgi:succinoglycan biosynthesis protein ExoO